MIQEQIDKVLREIQERIPRLWKERVVSNKKATPTMEKVIGEVLKTGNLTLEKREQLKTLYDSGMFSKVKPVEDPKYAKMIDEFVTREIKKAVKKGLLPKKYQR